jgi:hypothetical protein
MAEETKTVVLTQPPGQRLALGTAPQHPLVHMVCWDAEACKVQVAGRVTLAGDEKAPFAVKMSHHFANDHHQTHKVEPLDHALKVNTALASPIHHALQLRTPLQVRFCNTWEAASDYEVELRVGERSLLSLRLKGTTTCTPRPCPDERDCAEVSVALPGNPLVPQ